MKKETVKVMMPVDIQRFYADDGTEFDSEEACLSYERQKLFNTLMQVPRCAPLDDEANFDGGENYENSEYRWYKPESKEHIQILFDVYATIDRIGAKKISNDLIGKWICIESDSVGVWITTLDEAIKYASDVLEKLGYKMTVEEVGKNEI